MSLSISLLWLLRVYDLGLSGNSSGFLHAYSSLNSSILVSPTSPLFDSTNLFRVCRKIGKSGAFPISKLIQLNHTSSDRLYMLDGCEDDCYDLYLQCKKFPFRLDPSGDIRLNFMQEWTAFCFKTKFSLTQAKIFCENLGLPHSNISVTDGSRGSYSRSYKLTLECPSRSCKKKIVRLDESNCLPQGFPAMKCNELVVDARLVNTSGIGKGLLQVSHKYGWVYVKSYTVDDEVLEVFCRFLGYSTSNSNFYQVKPPVAGRGLSVDGYNCIGNESTIKDCPHYKEKDFLTSADFAVFLSCTSASEGDWRVRGGYADQISGRLQVFLNSTWVEICENSFGTNEIYAACSTISDGRIRGGYLVIERFPGGIGSVFYSVQCPQGAASLTECQLTRELSFCSVVNIQCSEKPEFRLGQSIEDLNVLEVLHNGEWGTICTQSKDIETAKTVCNTIGRPSQYAQIKSVSYDVPEKTMWLNGFTCATEKQNLTECGEFKWSQLDFHCTPQRVMAVNCDTPDLSNLEIRLTGTPSKVMGLVQVKYKDRWGNMCGYHPDHKVAMVICRSLNLPTENARLMEDEEIPFTFINQVWLDNIECDGHESSIIQCDRYKFHPGENFDCGNDRKLAVVCGVENTYPVRLGGAGASFSGGRLEMQVNGEWGPVCATGFYIDEMVVACTMLGAKDSTPKKLYTDKYTLRSSSGVNWRVNAFCQGDEEMFSDCRDFYVELCNTGSALALYCKDEERGPNVALIAGLCGGIGGLVIIMFWPLVLICIQRYRSKKHYDAPPGGRAPLGKRIDRLGGMLLDQEEDVASSRPVISNISRPDVYGDTHHTATREEEQPGIHNAAFMVPSAPISSDLSPGTESVELSTLPPPRYEDVFPHKENMS